MSLKYHFGGILLLLLGTGYYFLVVAGKQDWVRTKFFQWRALAGFRVAFVSVIFLYTFWGFFLRSSI